MFVDGTNCSVYPEPEVNVTGTPGKGLPRYGEVTGTVDAHMHHMAFEFLSGLAHCGQPWHRYGVAFALVDCPDHEAGRPRRGSRERHLRLRRSLPCPRHPWLADFPDWPHHNSLTHEQSYYKWLERSWRSGLRVFTNLLVENRVLCEIYPPYGKKNSAMSLTASSCRPSECTSSRTTSMPRKAARARAGTGSSTTLTRPARSPTRASSR